MASPILAFRPPSAVGRLDPRSGACPLSTRELLAAAAARGIVLPLVQAPVAGVARAALLAAKGLQAAVGLGLPAGRPPEPWFDAVARVADEVAPGLPLFLAGEVILAGEGATQVERAVAEAWRLVGAGLTHLALDAAAVAPGERGRVLAEVAAPAAERGLCVELVATLADGARAGERAAAAAESLSARGVAVDLASLRCPAPADDGEARLQAAALARLAQALGGVAVMRRGPVTAAVQGLLRGSPVLVCEDGGAVAARARAAGAEAPGAGAAGEGGALPRELSERLEAQAFFDALELLEGLGAAGSAAAVAAALEERLEER